MKRISANTPEGKKLLEKYKGAIYQDGGQTQLEAASRQLTEKWAHLPWVDRVINNSPDSIKNNDGSISTHEMAYRPDGDKAYVFPTIIVGKNGLQRLTEDEAFDYAKKNNTLMEVDSVELADYYSKTGLIKHQNGGVQPEQILSGAAVTGVDPNRQPVNAEVENNEFLKMPDGVVSKVEGKRHTEGGEKMNLEAGTQILSDNIKIGAENAKHFKKVFDVKVKAEDTFASVHKKIKSKLGISKAEGNQEEHIKALAKNEKIEDETTRRVNEDFIGDKINDSEQLLQVKKQEERIVYDILFDAQEQRKNNGEKNIRRAEAPTQGGNGNPEVQGQDGGQIQYYQDGGPKDLTTATPTPEPITGSFQFPAGLWKEDDLSDEDKAKIKAEFATWFENFKKANPDPSTWGDLTEYITVAGTHSPTPVSVRTKKALKLPADATNAAANAKLAEYRGETMRELLKSYLTEQDFPDVAALDNIKVGKGVAGEGSYNPIDEDGNPLTGEDLNNYIAGEAFRPYQGATITLSVPEAPDDLKGSLPNDKDPYKKPTATPGGGPIHIQTPYRGYPSPLMTTQLNLPDAEKITPIKVSPEEALRENQRAFTGAMDVLGGAPGANVAPALAGMLGATQNANNQAIAEANRANAEYANQANIRNQEVGFNLDIARKQAMDLYGKENLAALDNTIGDIRSWQQQLSLDQINARREGRELRTMDALAPQYTFDQFGNVIFLEPSEGFYLPDNAAKSQIYGAPVGTPASTTAGSAAGIPTQAELLQFYYANQTV